ncbi:MAG: hypothetical protein AAGA81_03855 [Acidobacteriota bacterium]
MKTPTRRLDLANELTHARAAHARNRLALDRSRDRLDAKSIDAYEMLLSIADDWTRLGDAAAGVGEAMRASLESQRQSGEAA